MLMKMLSQFLELEETPRLEVILLTSATRLVALLFAASMCLLIINIYELLLALPREFHRPTTFHVSKPSADNQILSQPVPAWITRSPIRFTSTLLRESPDRKCISHRKTGTLR